MNFAAFQVFYLKHPDQDDFIPADAPWTTYDGETILDFGKLPAGTRLLIVSQPMESLLAEKEPPAEPNRSYKQNGVCFLGTPPVVEGKH